MSESNKTILERANAAVRAGDIEGFLVHCLDDIEWTTVGAETLRGKAAVRAWVVKEYVEPPDFTVRHLIADGDFVVAIGDIAVKDAEGKPVPHAYSDVWRIRDGKLAELKAFVIPLGG